jgi:hypothetical protein
MARTTPAAAAALLRDDLDSLATHESLFVRTSKLHFL